ncbi:hypothetical protein D3C76_986970 [compost metagenome]
MRVHAKQPAPVQRKLQQFALPGGVPAVTETRNALELQRLSLAVAQVHPGSAQFAVVAKGERLNQQRGGWQVRVIQEIDQQRQAMVVGRAFKRDQPLALLLQPVPLDGLVLGVVGQGDFHGGIALGALVDTDGKGRFNSGAGQQGCQAEREQQPWEGDHLSWASMRKNSARLANLRGGGDWICVNSQLHLRVFLFNVFPLNHVQNELVK